MEPDYITPPENNNTTQPDNDLTKSIQESVHKDLAQINGVYDERLKEAEQIKQSELLEIELCHKLRIQDIQSERIIELEKYRFKATKSVGELMVYMTGNNKKNHYKLVENLWIYFKQLLN
jgi:hypothetical protein